MPNIYINKKLNNKKKKSNFLSLVFFYILPFILINSCIFYILTAMPKLKIDILEGKNFKNAQIKITKESIFPIKNIKIQLENNDLELKKIDSKTYLAEVEKNGNLQINVVNLNTMEKSFYEYIDIIDDIPPVIDGQIKDKKVLINFSDEKSKIDYDSIYATNSKNEKIFPLNINKDKNTAIFKFDNSSLEVYVSDLAGNKVTANFSNK